mgnify:CR=1 FL=1
MKQIHVSETTQKELVKLLARHRTFKAFSRCKECSFKFVRLIDLRICPYCNINYVYAVFAKDKKGVDRPVVRPDLDHFLDHANNIKTRMIWDNLVPACQQCNSRLKHTKSFTRRTHLHPYYDDFDAIMKAVLIIKATSFSKNDSIDIEFEPHSKTTTCGNKKAERNITDFKLRERYKYHREEALSIVHRMQFYHAQKRGELAKLLGYRGELWSAIFPETDCEINQTSLGKLKRDIIEQLRTAMP